MTYTKIVTACLLLVSITANSQAIYTCMKDGKNSISDRPCQSSADEQKRLQYTPESNAKKVGASASTREYQNQDISSRSRQDQQPPQDVGSSQQEISNKYTCDRLTTTRAGIADAQRRNSTPALADQLKDIDSQMFSNGCQKTKTIEYDRNTQSNQLAPPVQQNSEKKEEKRKNYCKNLSAQRDSTIEGQRRNSTTLLSERLKSIDADMFSNDCHK